MFYSLLNPVRRRKMKKIKEYEIKGKMREDYGCGKEW
jgi:hypothetical protein